MVESSFTQGIAVGAGVIVGADVPPARPPPHAQHNLLAVKLSWSSIPQYDGLLSYKDEQVKNNVSAAESSFKQGIAVGEGVVGMADGIDVDGTGVIVESSSAATSGAGVGRGVGCGMGLSDG